MNIIRWLQSGFVRLRRMPRTRGFGVQSPSAYRFLRDVVSSKGRYAVINMPLETRDASERSRLILFQFYARLARFTQAKRWFVSKRLVSDALKAYVCAGHHAAVVSPVLDDSGVYVVDITEEYVVEAVLNQASASDLLIVEGIHRSATAREKWQQIMADRRTGVCFDLYKAGVVCFDLKKFKTSYRVNL